MQIIYSTAAFFCCAREEWLLTLYWHVVENIDRLRSSTRSSHALCWCTHGVAGQAVIKQAVQHMSRIVYCFCYSDFIFISFIFASIIIRIMYFFLLFISSSGLRVMSNEDEEESLASSSFSTRCSLGPHEMDTSLSIRFPNQVR